MFCSQGKSIAEMLVSQEGVATQVDNVCSHQVLREVLPDDTAYTRSTGEEQAGKREAEFQQPQAC